MDDVAGLEEAKSALVDVFMLPLKFPDIFPNKLQPWKAVLLYGPPGTGKTRLAQACANICSYAFLNVSSADIYSKWQGESEKHVRDLFQLAREKAPTIIFIDEIDSLCTVRSEQDSESSTRVKTEFLSQMQGLEQTKHTIIVLGATNVPWVLDSAFRRRFERRIYIPLPGLEARIQMIKLHMKNVEHTLSEEALRRIATETENYSGSDMEGLVRDVMYMSVRRLNQIRNDLLIECSEKAKQLSVITEEDFNIALKRSSSTVDLADIKKYEAWTAQYGLKI